MENTCIIHDDAGQCIIIDPGCSEKHEQEELAGFIRDKGLKPMRLIQTHCHLDHVMGSRWVAGRYGLILEMHELDLPLLESATVIGESYGVRVDPPPKPGKFLIESDTVEFGKTSLEVIFTPGHAPGHICLYCKSSGFVIVGDVLFRGSIGRYDFPLSNYADLMHSITGKLFLLPDETVVYPGHGPTTTIGEEKRTNPFIMEYLERSLR